MPAAERMSKNRLDGWKEISAYLGRDIRTCQRWEKDFLLPVYRIDESSDRSKIFSFRSEIDNWLKTKNCNKVKQSRLKRKPPAHFWVMLLLPVLAGLVYFLFINPRFIKLTRARYSPADFEIKGNHLVFKDILDNALWYVKIDSKYSQEKYYRDEDEFSLYEKGDSRYKRRRIDFWDVDNDRKNEVLLALNHDDPSLRRVALYDHFDREIWSRGIRLEQQFREGLIPNNFHVTELEFEDLDNNGSQEILVLWTHKKRFPSVFLIYDLEGRELFRYEHTGRLIFFTIGRGEHERKLIYLGGTNNLLAGDAVLVIFDPAHASSGLGPPYSVSPDLMTQAKSLEKYIPLYPKKAVQKYYLRFNKNEVSRLLGVKWMNVLYVSPDEEGITAYLNFGAQNPVLMYYYFTPGMRLRSVQASADLKRAFSSLREKNRIGFSLEHFRQKCLVRDFYYWDGSFWVRPDGTSEFHSR
jgi:hypothetical protein